MKEHKKWVYPVINGVKCKTDGTPIKIGKKMLSIDEINNRKPVNSRLTVVSRSERKGKSRDYYLNCICSCGKHKEILLGEVISGGTISCGCAQTDELIKRNTKFSIKIPKPLYSCYHDMIRRCYDTECNNYRFYGANGVIVCEEWRNNPESFYKWALNNGWTEGLQIDKDIKGSGKMYSPEDCLFVTFEENLKHKKPVGRNEKGKFFSLNKNIS